MGSSKKRKRHKQLLLLNLLGFGVVLLLVYNILVYYNKKSNVNYFDLTSLPHYKDGYKKNLTARFVIDKDILRQRRNFKETVETAQKFFQQREKDVNKACQDVFSFASESEIKISDKNQSRLAKKQLLNELRIMPLRDFQAKHNLGPKRVPLTTKRRNWISYKFTTYENKTAELLWCPVFKAASTPWMAVFTTLTNALSEHTEWLIKKGKVTFNTITKNFRMQVSAFIAEGSGGVKDAATRRFRMMVVRHPFRRILSAYKDKLERVQGRQYFHNTYGKKIIREFRTRENRNSRYQDSPLWLQLAMNLHPPHSGHSLKLDKPVLNSQLVPKKSHQLHNVTLITKADADEKIDGSVPTFEEFVRYLMAQDPKTMDEHWRPQFIQCSPCHTHFHFILKVESLEREKEEIFKVLGIHGNEKVLSAWSRWNNPSLSKKSENFYFSQLTESQLHALYGIYEKDFLLFDYSPEEHFEMVTKDEVVFAE